MKASRGCLGRRDLEILARAMLVAMADLIEVLVSTIHTVVVQCQSSNISAMVIKGPAGGR